MMRLAAFSTACLMLATPVLASTAEGVVSTRGPRLDAWLRGIEPGTTGSVEAAPAAPAAPALADDPLAQAVAALREASSVIVVPGYGMAQAHAQFAVVGLAEALERQHKQVRFAVHPVAGRMPGHMHVLLAEAEADYEKLFEMKDIADDFATTDVVLVVGACDVVNPASVESQGTPISGMPILPAHEAGRVIVCNLDAQPGYSGVPNTLYDNEKAILLFGDAKETVGELLAGLDGAPAAAAPVADDPLSQATAALQEASSVIIVPGYGMAQAHAQFRVVALAEELERRHKQVRFAVHPVAGRMPGHMHVLLAEAEVDYTQIRELKDVNTEFPMADLALIVGACDVVNPAAIDVAGTPISGMPILRAHEAREVIVCNLDDRPGYSGVENPLYREPRTIMLLGDAKETVSRILDSLSGPKEDKV